MNYIFKTYHLRNVYKMVVTIALVVLSCFILSACESRKHSENTDEGSVVNKSISEADAWYSSIFDQKASKYNIELALWAARLSEATEYKNSDDKNIKDKIEELLQEKEVKDIQSENYGNWNNSAYTLGHYRLETGEEDTEILLIVCRGSTCFFEYVGDLFKGLGRGMTQDFLGDHIWDNVHDFEEIVWDGLEVYLKDHPEIVYAPNLKVLITGHSLGGAAANAVGARLTSENREGTRLPGNLSQDSIYVYTFNAIDVLSHAGNNKDGYENIHNIYNYYDSFGPHGNLGGYGASDPEQKFGHTDLYFLRYDETDSFPSSRNHVNYVTAVEQNLVTCGTPDYEAHDIDLGPAVDGPDGDDTQGTATVENATSHMDRDTIIKYMGYYYDPHKPYQHYGKAYDHEGNFLLAREDGKNWYASNVHFSMGGYFSVNAEYNQVGIKEYLTDLNGNVLKELTREDLGDDFQKSSVAFYELEKGLGIIRVGYEYYDLDMNPLPFYGEMRERRGKYFIVKDPEDYYHYQVYDTKFNLIKDIPYAFSVELVNWEIEDEVYLVVDMAKNYSSGKYYSDVTVFDLDTRQKILRVKPGEARYDAYTYTFPCLIFDRPDKQGIRIVFLKGGEIALDIKLPYEDITWPGVSINQGTGRIEIKHGFYETVYDFYDINKKSYLYTSKCTENVDKYALPKSYYKEYTAYVRDEYGAYLTGTYTAPDAQNKNELTFPEEYTLGGFLNYDIFKLMYEEQDRFVFLGRKMVGDEWKYCLFDGKTGEVLFEMREGYKGPFLDNTEAFNSVFLVNTNSTKTEGIIYNIITGKQVEFTGKLVDVDGVYVTIEEEGGTIRVYNFDLESFGV